MHGIGLLIYLNAATYLSFILKEIIIHTIQIIANYRKSIPYTMLPAFMKSK